ncbi:lasso peptide biosynthesis B2 protein [Bacteroidota bacterium]
MLLLYARILVLFVPFKKLAPKMGEHMKETTTPLSEQASETALKIGRVIKKASQFTPVRSMCFEQAITANIMLQKRGIATTIYFGVLKQKDDGNEMKAHAWIKAGGQTITGNRGMKKFTVVSTFGN